MDHPLMQLLVGGEIVLVALFILGITL